MANWYANVSFKYLIQLLVGLAIIVLAITRLHRFFNFHQQEHYKIGIIINSVEIEPEDLQNTKLVIEKKIKELNQANGINGHPVKAVYLDDKGSYEELKKTGGRNHFR